MCLSLRSSQIEFDNIYLYWAIDFKILVISVCYPKILYIIKKVLSIRIN